MVMKDVLDTLRECDALLEGHFELRSGLHSDRFFQCANVLRYPRIAGALCGQLVAKAKSSSALPKFMGNPKFLGTCDTCD